MHFVILGSGAVGGYFGGRLAESGQNVSFIARGEHLSVMQQQGLTINSINGDCLIKPAKVVKNGEALTAAPDVILLAVKSFQLNDVLPQLKAMITPSTSIIPLLNGVNAAQILIENGIDALNIYGGVAKIISELSAPGVIAHTGAEPHITLGRLRQNNNAAYLEQELPTMEAITDCFKQAKVSIGIAKDIELALWRKFIFVAAWGAFAASLKLPLGSLRQSEHREKLLAIINEYAVIAQALGVAITEHLIEQTVNFIDALPANSETSMQRDIANGRPSEFDSLVTYPYQLAKHYRLATPVLEHCYQQLINEIVS